MPKPDDISRPVYSIGIIWIWTAAGAGLQGYAGRERTALSRFDVGADGLGWLRVCWVGCFGRSRKKSWVRSDGEVGKLWTNRFFLD